MLNRIRTVGEDFSNPEEATLNLVFDGTQRQYVRVGEKWYLLRFISDGTKNELVSHRLKQIDYLRGFMLLHKDAALYLRQNVTDDTTEFQHMIIFHHVSIAFFLSDAFSLIERGSLASALVLFRPAVELMIEIQYLKRHPSAVASYYEKVEKHNRQTQKEGKPIERTRRNLRFEKIQNLIKTLKYGGNPSEFEEALIEQWESLSSGASHITPELLDTAQVRQEWAWDNTFGELDKVTRSAIDQIRNVDESLGHLIEQAEDLRFEERLRNLFSYGTSTSPLDRNEGASLVEAR